MTKREQWEELQFFELANGDQGEPDEDDWDDEDEFPEEDWDEIDE
ncbi:MAG TPA: hypothetical protein PKU80_08730 [Candidatus Limiplasma sp.]|nr:hypothetical protein [Candidatus Limiplasma sp.]HRX07825.1 hypothetical protein [Candidatus Limiplasma sp.]